MAKATTASIKAKQKIIKVFDVIMSTQMGAEICISVMNASVNEMERIYLGVHGEKVYNDSQLQCIKSYVQGARRDR